MLGVRLWFRDTGLTPGSYVPTLRLYQGYTVRNKSRETVYEKGKSTSRVAVGFVS